MDAVIMAGGRGTRIEKVAEGLPKPLIPIAGKPVLEHQIQTLTRQGIQKIYLMTGYQGSQIQDYFEEGSQWGVSLQYIQEEEPLGSAGSLFFLKEKITEDFLLLNGDLIFDVDLKSFSQYHLEKQAYVTLLTHPNSHPYDSALVVTNQEGRVRDWIHKENRTGDYRNRVNAGIHFCSPQLLQSLQHVQRLDLDRDLLKPFLTERKIYAYDSTEYVKDMGTPERYQMVEEDLILGRVEKRNRNKPQQAIFLDRDGTVNVHKGFLIEPEEMELIGGVAETIREMNRQGYLVILVTNQPVIARGDCTVEELEKIHHRLETLLGEKGAYLDGIFYCPHHPEKGFPGERKAYKIECACRKPKPGLLLKAAQQYRIDLEQSFLIGDSSCDVEAGRAVGCCCFQVKQNQEGELKKIWQQIRKITIYGK